VPQAEVLAIYIPVAPVLARCKATSPAVRRSRQRYLGLGRKSAHNLANRQDFFDAVGGLAGSKGRESGECRPNKYAKVE
jgi:hypothetical protein